MNQTMISDRAYTGSESDLQAVTDLLNLCDARFELSDNYSPSDLRSEFSAPEVDMARDLHLWEDAQGSLIGFGQIHTRAHAEDTVADGFLYLRIHPDHQDAELEDAMIGWGEARMREIGQQRGLPVTIRSGAPQHYTVQQDMLARHGYEPARYFFDMVRDLNQPIPAFALPEGFTLSHVDGEEDLAQWVEAYNLSFIDHYNFHPLTIEAHNHWLKDPSYKPELDLIAKTPDGIVAAYALCFVSDESNTRNSTSEGWVGILGVRRGYRKIGLGKAMLIAGMHALKQYGLTTAKLGVDAENPSGALQLYESVGFERKLTRQARLKRLSE